jgi:hypothetical protein
METTHRSSYYRELHRAYWHLVRVSIEGALAKPMILVLSPTDLQALNLEDGFLAHLDITGRDNLEPGQFVYLGEEWESTYFPQ